MSGQLLDGFSSVSGKRERISLFLAARARASGRWAVAQRPVSCRARSTAIAAARRSQAEPPVHRHHVISRRRAVDLDRPVAAVRRGCASRTSRTRSGWPGVAVRRDVHPAPHALDLERPAVSVRRGRAFRTSRTRSGWPGVAVRRDVHPAPRALDLDGQAVLVRRGRASRTSCRDLDGSGVGGRPARDGISGGRRRRPGAGARRGARGCGWRRAGARPGRGIAGRRCRAG